MLVILVHESHVEQQGPGGRFMSREKKQEWCDRRALALDSKDGLCEYDESPDSSASKCSH